MARPREPVDLIEYKGKKHLTKEEKQQRRESEVRAPSDKVTPPAWLSKKEKGKFEEIAGELLKIGIISNLDCDVLARYVRSQTEYEKVTKQLAKIKFIPDRKSMVREETQMEEQTARYNYLHKIQTRAERQCNADARELGLTISSRCRLVVPKKQDEPKPNKFMKHA
jgi:P27 family predicted phage terminase small subunit